MTPTKTNNPAGSQTPFVNATNQSIRVNGIPFAYRDIGLKTGVPLVLFNHWGAVLDNFDPGSSMAWHKHDASLPPTIAASAAPVEPRH